MSPRHVCHALRCDVPVPPKILMCKRHWFMVPKTLRDRVWATYRAGQERDRRVKGVYLDAANAAINAVAAREGIDVYQGVVSASPSGPGHRPDRPEGGRDA